MNLFRDVNNRPYLNWMFNECCDIESAENIYWNPELEDTFFSLFYNTLDHDRLYRHYYLSNGDELFEIHKGNAIILHCQGTVEFRFFDMVRCEKDLLCHVNFVNAYCRWIYKRTKKKEEIEPKIKSKKDFKALAHKDRCVMEFYDLLEELKLNPEDYKQFVKMNYQKRKIEGELR